MHSSFDACCRLLLVRLYFLGVMESSLKCCAEFRVKSIKGLKKIKSNQVIGEVRMTDAVYLKVVFSTTLHQLVRIQNTEAGVWWSILDRTHTHRQNTGQFTGIFVCGSVYLINPTSRYIGFTLLLYEPRDLILAIVVSTQ